MEEYFKKIIAYHTTEDDLPAIHAALDYLQDFFEHRKMIVTRYNFGNHPSLIATVTDTKTPKVMLAAHIDVVTGNDSLFKLREEDGKYLGRGVNDMKCAIAAYMDVIDKIKDQIDTYDIGIMITSDEEIGGSSGTQSLVELGYKPQVCVLPDGGDNWQIETLAKGLFYGRIEVKGTSAHGSRPWEGDSASFKLIELLQEVKGLFAEQAIMTSTLNIAQLTAGTSAINQLPESAWAGLDIRFLSVSSFDTLKARIDAICEKYDAVLIQELYGAPCINKLDEPLVKAFAESIQRVTGVEVKGSMSLGATDARYFAAHSIPCVIVEPPAGGRHADNEWIDKQGFLQFSPVILDYLDTVARI